MSTSELVHDDTFCFNGTNYIMWRLRMLCHFRAMGPNALRIVVVGNSNLKDGQSPSLDDMHLDCEALSLFWPPTGTKGLFWPGQAAGTAPL